ncbi:MAG: c-type cytochrome [Kiritimatiellaeota bacterium]|nr:c-type cytochrome [Kiritimatiellota bacterium]
MKMNTVKLVVVLLAALLSGACQEQNTVEREPWLSPLALVVESQGRYVYVAAATGGCVLCVDVADGKVVRTFALPDNPTGLCLSADGQRLFVTMGVAPGQLLVLDTGTGKILAALPVGHSPTAPVAAPDGKTIYVCNQFLNTVSVVDWTTQKVLAQIPVEREPVAAALNADGTRLFVANLLPSGSATRDVVAAAVSVIDLGSRAVSRIALPNGSTSVRGMTLSADGKYVYVTHTLAHYQLPTTQLERGWMNTSALSVIAAAGATLVNTVLLDEVSSGAANPWGVAVTPDGQWLCVAHAGTHEVSVIDRVALHERLAKAAKGERVTEVSTSPDNVPNDLSFLVGIRRRVKLDGHGPRGLTVAGHQPVTAMYFSGALQVLTVPTNDAPVTVRTVALGVPAPLTAARRGEQAFHDAGSCFQHWQSCATCHPDARADALNWDLLNDGMGNPKQTKSFILTMQTPPAMISGVRETPEEAIRAGMKHIQFSVPVEEDMQAIAAYLGSLKPVPSPHATTRRGRKVFAKAGCAACHPKPLFTDLKPHDVGAGSGNEKGQPWDTPTLVEIRRTAPYLYDGRAATLEEALTKYNPGDQHGQTSTLSKEELADLVAYVLSL